jgi:hypothetical protein
MIDVFSAFVMREIVRVVSVALVELLRAGGLLPIVLNLLKNVKTRAE